MNHRVLLPPQVFYRSSSNEGTSFSVRSNIIAVSAFMTQHTLIIRGIDDESHSRLGELANQRGVSINSTVRDDIDKWLKKQSDTPRKHYLVIYSDDDSLVQLLKPIDSLAREAGLVRCFCGPPDSLITKHLVRLNWYNGTVEPYLEPSNRNITKYFDGLMKNISMNADNKQVCCMDFVINDFKFLFETSTKYRTRLRR